MPAGSKAIPGTHINPGPSSTVSPHGSGTDYKQCFETFITDCDAFIEKVKAIRDQARTHMEELLAAVKELENHED